MKRLSFILAFGVLALTAGAAKKTVIDRIEPAYWYVGMKNPQLQLMVYGKDIASVSSVTTDYPGVSVERLVMMVMASMESHKMDMLCSKLRILSETHILLASTVMVQ